MTFLRGVRGKLIRQPELAPGLKVRISGMFQRPACYGRAEAGRLLFRSVHSRFAHTLSKLPDAFVPGPTLPASAPFYNGLIRQCGHIAGRGHVLHIPCNFACSAIVEELGNEQATISLIRSRSQQQLFQPEQRSVRFLCRGRILRLQRGAWC